MKDLIQAQEKEFDKKFVVDGIMVLHTPDRERVLNWHKSSTKALLEAVIEEMEEMKVLTGGTEGFGEIASWNKGRKEALTDLQDKLKEEMSKV